MEHGAWSTEHGARSSELGAQSTEHGARSSELRARSSEDATRSMGRVTSLLLLHVFRKEQGCKTINNTDTVFRPRSPWRRKGWEKVFLHRFWGLLVEGSLIDASAGGGPPQLKYHRPTLHGAPWSSMELHGAPSLRSPPNLRGRDGKCKTRVAVSCLPNEPTHLSMSVFENLYLIPRCKLQLHGSFWETFRELPGLLGNCKKKSASTGGPLGSHAPPSPPPPSLPPPHSPSPPSVRGEGRGGGGGAMTPNWATEGNQTYGFMEASWKPSGSFRDCGHNGEMLGTGDQICNPESTVKIKSAVRQLLCSG